MVRSFLYGLSVFVCLGVVAGTGCRQTGVGDPCFPEQEYDKSFLGFAEQEVNVESKSYQCQTRLCLVNHFRGRVTCPYGQDSTGNPPSGAEACLIPGSEVKVDGLDADGNPTDPRVGSTVRPQCIDRLAKNAVYCSCRCANADGLTNDGARYCSCPDGYQCEQLVAPLGQVDVGLTGAYCIKAGTAFDPNQGPCARSCVPGQDDAECDFR
jgi:hypothetical protein